MPPPPPQDFLPWSDKDFGLGIPALDEEHQRMVQSLNELYAAVLRRDRSLVGGLFQLLVMETRRNFAEEEAEMERLDFPHRTTHQADHSRLMREAAELHARYLGGTVSALALPTLLRDWLRQHMVGHDRDWGRWLQRNGPFAGAGR